MMRGQIPCSAHTIGFVAFVRYMIPLYDSLEVVTKGTCYTRHDADIITVVLACSRRSVCSLRAAPR